MSYASQEYYYRGDHRPPRREKLPDAVVPRTEARLTSNPSDRHNAVRYVASEAHDADDLRALLEMLGLRPEEGLN